ncbi:TPA: hypothetical protein HA318_04005, partial [Candidatus Micrarchaeota archaeon]|nr:hypothetical protein [Candidatus Micrarchaeota archaeon]
MARRHVRRGKKYLGNRSYGVGNIKNNRGKGSKGGKGLAGLGKHKWMQTIKSGKLDEIKARHKGFSNPAKRTLKN